METETAKYIIDSDLYSRRRLPLDSTRQFVEERLPQFNWNESTTEEAVMDIGCGPGENTHRLILPSIKKVKKIVAVDLVPEMIELARERNFHSQIEYHVADIQDWCTVKNWENQMTKVISIQAFHWLKNQRVAFQNVFRLLKCGGEAAFIFGLNSTFFDSVVEIGQKNPKWSEFLKGVDDYVPESHIKKLNSSHYKKMLEEIGFEIRYCKEELKRDVYSSDEDMKNLFASLFVPISRVPKDQVEDFKNDLFKEILSRNGRDKNGLPYHSGERMEIIIRKK